MQLKPVAVIDTNVIANIVTCMDAVNHSARPGWSVDSATSRADRAKARQATILSWHLHEISAETFSLHEARWLIFNRVSPDALADDKTHFTIIWAHYVKDRLLPAWRMTDPALEEPEFSGSDAEVLAELKRRWDLEPKGDDADQLYVDRARSFGVPLITFEGLRDSGQIDHRSGIRLKAADAGVTVLTPAEFYTGRDENQTCDTFYGRWVDGAADYINSARHPDVTRDSMATFDGYYRYILYGEVKGRNEPVSVTF